VLLLSDILKYVSSDISKRNGIGIQQSSTIRTD
jgi:hypothetical protein